MRLIAIPFLVMTALLTACSEDKPYVLSCAESAVYTPYQQAIAYTGAGTPTTTVIVMHGKSGSPNTSHLAPLYSSLQSAGYDVKVPYMAWGHHGGYPDTGYWNGTLCQAMQYVNTLVETEKQAGRNVVLVGHSMGGAGALIYNAVENLTEVDATISIAPGHFMHKSNTLQTATAASVAVGREMVAQGSGDSTATFQTYNNGVEQAVDTTANIYLSYHDLSQYPDIVNNVLGENQGPLFWIGGESDSLTTAYDYAGLFSSRVPKHVNSQYQTLPGTHLTVVENSTNAIINWLISIGL